MLRGWRDEIPGTWNLLAEVTGGSHRKEAILSPSSWAVWWQWQMTEHGHLPDVI